MPRGRTLRVDSAARDQALKALTRFGPPPTPQQLWPLRFEIGAVPQGAEASAQADLALPSDSTCGGRGDLRASACEGGRCNAWPVSRASVLPGGRDGDPRRRLAGRPRRRRAGTWGFMAHRRPIGSESVRRDTSCDLVAPETKHSGASLEERFVKALS